MKSLNFRCLVVGAFLLTSLLISNGCSPGGDDSASPAVGDPVAIPLEGLDPEAAASLAELLEAARSDPGNARARARLGMAYDVNILPAAAMKSFRQAAALDPSEPKWLYHCAMAEAAEGDLEQAIGTMDQVINLEATYAPAYLYRAEWSYDIGLEDQALAGYREAKRLNPQSLPALLGEVRILLNRNEETAALEILNELEANHRDPYIQQLIGRAYRQQGDMERAAEILKSSGVGGTRPGWPDPWSEEKGVFQTGFGTRLLLAGKLMKADRIVEATEVLEQLRADRPDDLQVLNNLCVGYIKMKRIDDARELLLDAIERYPDNFPFHLNLAEIYTQQGDVRRAMEQLDEAIRIKPTLSHAWQQKGLLLIKLRKLPEALEAMDQAIVYDARNAGLFMSAAILELQLKRHSRALERTDQALSIEPQLGPVHLVRAGALIELGRYDDASVALDRAAKFGMSARQVQSVRKQLESRKAGA